MQPIQLQLWADDETSERSAVEFGRPIHYLGSKLRLVDSISARLNELDPGHGKTVDLFAGSGTVSAAIAETRPVVAVDIQEYSRVLCSAILKPANEDRGTLHHILNKANELESAKALRWATQPLIEHEEASLQSGLEGNPDPLCDILEYGSLYTFTADVPPSIPDQTELANVLATTVERLKQVTLEQSPTSTATRYFGGVYFSYRQAVEIDCLLEVIQSVAGGNRDIYTAAVLSAASDAVNTVGKHFAQPLRPRNSDGMPKPGLAKRMLEDRTYDIQALFQQWISRYYNATTRDPSHKVVRADYRSFLDSYQGEPSILYADPPYTRDHYSRFYHVLETLCLRDNPLVSTTRIGGETRLSRGLYRENRHQSPFCIRSKAEGAFEKLFSSTRPYDAPLLLSYSPQQKSDGGRPRLMSIDELKSLALKYYSDVTVRSAGAIAHNKLNRKELNVGMSYDAEVLLLCRP